MKRNKGHCCSNATSCSRKEDYRSSLKEPQTTVLVCYLIRIRQGLLVGMWRFAESAFPWRMENTMKCQRTPVPAIRSPILRKTSSSPHPASDNDMAVVLTVSTARTESTVSHVTNFNKLITDRPFWEKLSANPTVQTISYAEAGASSSYTWPCQCQYCRRDLWRSLSSLNNVIREITELCIRFTVLMEMFGNSRCICVPVYMFNVWSIMTVSYRRVLYERLPMMPRPCQYGDYLAQYLTKFLVF
jgi:hypothetical protein